MHMYELPLKEIDLTALALPGRVLDIGGGGEAVISRKTGDGVVAIDTRRDELEEVPDIGLKIVMNACDMAFLDGMFDHVTLFYTLMYMDERDAGRCLGEAARVLKFGGSLLIWDAQLEERPKEPVFLAPLRVTLDPLTTITTTYGASWQRPYGLEQTAQMLKNTGLSICEQKPGTTGFFLCAEKA